jgi:hypothetical protein
MLDKAHVGQRDDFPVRQDVPTATGNQAPNPRHGHRFSTKLMLHDKSLHSQGL